MSLIYVILIGLGFLIAVLWVLMPFAIFGTKEKLQTLIDETIATRKSLETLIESLKK